MIKSKLDMKAWLREQELMDDMTGPEIVAYLQSKRMKTQKVKRKRKHGFLKRSLKRTGRTVLKKRRTKKRKRLTV